MKKVYENMLKQDSTKIAREYLENELHFIKKTLSDVKEKSTVVVVGCNQEMYSDVIRKYGFYYVGIDPYTHNTNSTAIYQMKFESYAQKRSIIHQENCVFIFWFNVLSHIDISKIRDCFFKGDIIINSVWGKNKPDLYARDKYYSTFNDNTLQYKQIIRSAKKTKSLNDIGIQFQSINSYSQSPNYFEVAYV